MALPSNTTITYGVTSAGGMREDLSDVIFDLFPEDTWAVTNLEKETAQSTTTEWLAQQLAAPAANIAVEGDDAAYASLTPPTRYSTYTQIMQKSFVVSDTLEAVNKAGRSKEAARGAMVKMRELKRDFEYAILGQAISTTGGATTGRSFAGMETWIGGTTADPGSTTANAVRATTTANNATTPAVTSGTAGTAPTNSTTTGALTSAILNQALMGAWAQGGDPRVIIVGPALKASIDNLSSVATRFVDVDRTAQATIIGAANVYVSDFGKHTVILSRYMTRSDTVLCVDPDYWALRFLRKPQQRQLAKTGDATKYQIIQEAALVARNWKASSKVVAAT